MDYYRYLDMIWKLSNWYFSKDALPYWCIFVLDCLIVLGADVLVYALNNGTLSLLQNFVQLTGAFCFYLLFYVVVSSFFWAFCCPRELSAFTSIYRNLRANDTSRDTTAAKYNYFKLCRQDDIPRTVFFLYSSSLEAARGVAEKILKLTLP